MAAFPGFFGLDIFSYSRYWMLDHRISDLIITVVFMHARISAPKGRTHTAHSSYDHDQSL